LGHPRFELVAGVAKLALAVAQCLLGTPAVSGAPTDRQPCQCESQKAGQVEETPDQRIEPWDQWRQYQRGEQCRQEPGPRATEPCGRDDRGEEQARRMKERSDTRRVEQYGDSDANRGQRIAEGRGFFQRRHEAMPQRMPVVVAHGHSP
jgi:hypothetical protein